MGVELHPDTLSLLLRRWPVGRLGSVTAGGDPHLVPVVFVADAGIVYSPVDGKRKSASALARLSNVTANGRASLLLDRYDDDWSRLWWVRLDGPAWVERAGPVLGRVEALLREKYPQYATVAPYRGEPAALALRWERVRAWAESGRLDFP